MIRCTASQSTVHHGALQSMHVPSPVHGSNYPSITRRNVGILSLTTFTSSLLVQQTAPAAAEPDILIDSLPDIDIRNMTSLQAAMVAQAVPESPGVSFALTKKQKQLFYPAWLEGTWKAEGRLAGIGFPLGGEFLSPSVPGLTKASLIAAIADVGVGQEQPVGLELRWEKNGQQGGVVADRVFNIRQQVDAFLGEPSVRSVLYNPTDDPTRVSIEYITKRKDTAPASANAPSMPVDVRRAQLFINNRRSQQPSENVFVCSELYRQVNQAKRQGSVGDYEVFWEYTRDPNNPDTVQARQRVAAYLQPEDALYFQSGNRAVATYDYTYVLTKLTSP